jgi:lambda repressor-like predicted transcriptional regulator
VKPARASDVPKNDPVARRAWVIGRLHGQGITAADIAVREGVSPAAMSRVMTEPNSHLEEVIAKAIGLSARELFPERFDADGNRRFRTRERQRTMRAKGREAARAGAL